MRMVSDLGINEFQKKGFICQGDKKKQLGHARYRTFWSMMHRVRMAMGMRDDLYKLVGYLNLI